jgi:hypothetical protein
MRIINYSSEYKLNAPIYGGAADVAAGGLVKRGATPATNNGMLISANGTSAIPDVLGILNSKLTYATDGETLIAGTAFVTKPVELLNPVRVIRCEYSKASADLITCTQAVSTTTMTVTSLEDDIDASFVYVAAGVGIGQTNYNTAAAAGASTLKAAFTTALDTTSKFIKILPRFHPFAILNSAGTKLASQAGVGAITVTILDTYIERNGRIDQMDPTKHAALTGLDALPSLRFWADLLIRDAIPYSID